MKYALQISYRKAFQGILFYFSKRYVIEINRTDIRGSNPSQSIESSVPIPKIGIIKRYCNSKTTNDQILKNQSTPDINISYEMRDLYNRKRKLAYWINRANTELQEPDKTDVLTFIQFMHDKERSILWIIRCITALLLMRRHLEKALKMLI
jgi:hypothetical protein